MQHFAPHRPVPAAAGLSGALGSLSAPSSATSPVPRHCRSNQAEPCGLAAPLFDCVVGKGSPLSAGWGSAALRDPVQQPAGVFAAPSSAARRRRGRKIATAAPVALCRVLRARLSTFPTGRSGLCWGVTAEVSRAHVMLPSSKENPV